MAPNAVSACLVYPNPHPLVNHFSPPSSSGPGGPLLSQLHIDIDTIAESIAGKLVLEFHWPRAEAGVIRGLLEFLRDHSNLAWPGVPTLARVAKVSPSTVKRATAKLRKLVVEIAPGLRVAGLRVLDVQEREAGPGPHLWDGPRRSARKLNTNTYDLSVFAYLLPAPLVSAFRAWLRDLGATRGGQNLPFVADDLRRRGVAAVAGQNLSDGAEGLSLVDQMPDDPFAVPAPASATGLGSPADRPSLDSGYGVRGGALRSNDRAPSSSDSIAAGEPGAHLSTDSVDDRSFSCNVAIESGGLVDPEARNEQPERSASEAAVISSKLTPIGTSVEHGGVPVVVNDGPGLLALKRLRLSSTLRDRVIAERGDFWAHKLASYVAWKPGVTNLAGYARVTFEKFENWDPDFERFYVNRYPQMHRQQEARRSATVGEIELAPLAALEALPERERDMLLREALQAVQEAIPGQMARRLTVHSPTVRARALALLQRSRAPSKPPKK